MAAKTTLSTPLFDTTWNGTDAFIDTRSVTVPSGTTHLCVRLVNNSATMPTIEFNGVALTLAAQGDDTNARACAIYYLAAPDIGTFDLVTNTGGVSRNIQMLIDAVSSSSGVGDFDSAGNALANRSLTLTTVSGDLVLDVLNSAQAATVGADQTADLLNTNNTSASNETATGTSTVMSWTHASDFTSQAAIVFTDGVAPEPVPGLSATTLNANGSPVASTTVTRTVTIAGGAEVFTGSVATDASGVLPELDLSATAVEVGNELIDRIEFTGTAPYRSAIEFNVLAEDIAE